MRTRRARLEKLIMGSLSGVRAFKTMVMALKQGGRGLKHRHLHGGQQKGWKWDGKGWSRPAVNSRPHRTFPLEVEKLDYVL